MNIRIRKASMRDAPFIRNLAVKSVEHGIPDTRRVSVETVRTDTRKALANLEIQMHDPNFEVIIAEDADTKKPVGYLMLHLNVIEESTGEKQSFIYDMAVEEKHWGKFIPDRMISRAEEITREKGLSYIAANVTVSNKRSMVYAIKRLKYQIERYQLVKVLD